MIVPPCEVQTPARQTWEDPEAITALPQARIESTQRSALFTFPCRDKSSTFALAGCGKRGTRCDVPPFRVCQAMAASRRGTADDRRELYRRRGAGNLFQAGGGLRPPCRTVGGDGGAGRRPHLADLGKATDLPLPLGPNPTPRRDVTHSSFRPAHPR